ncbi:MAG: hypothetical protein O3A51_07840 [Verrucomicrobia bacterium]|nr:hypothetical protein [Verrucomicrobiota bacterium]
MDDKSGRLDVFYARENAKIKVHTGGFLVIQPTLHRRQFLAAGIAGFTLALSAPYALGETLTGRIFPRRFGGSRTISSFATGLFWSEDEMPMALSRAIEAELARTNVPADSVAAERSHAEFFARLAMGVIAPRTLRHAGYEALAAGCEGERDFRPGGAAALAQHTIGYEFRSSEEPRLASFAYCACAHTSTCAFYAGYEEMETVVQSGTYLARALLAPFSYEDASATESAWIWNFAVATINAATHLCEESRLDRGVY